MHDVVIVGASVAGAATATHLARRGLRVLVIEKQREPGRKACGEGVFPAGVRALQRLGITDSLDANSARLEGVKFRAGPFVANARFPDGSHGRGVPRSWLDPRLRKGAERAGVEFAFGATGEGLAVRRGRVSAIRTATGEIPGRAFVAADGLGSRLRRLSGLDGRTRGNRFGISAHVELEAEPPSLVSVVFGGGYELYVTPVGGTCANVAVLTRKEYIAGLAGTVRATFEALLERHAEDGLNAATLLDEPLVAGPFPRSCSRAWRANLALVGDAAGFFDGISGDGISAALQGAEACADGVAEYLATGEYSALRRYERERRKIVRNSDWVARLSLQLSRSPALAARSVRNLQQQPATFDRLLAVSCGERDLSHLRPRDLIALGAGV